MRSHAKKLLSHCLIIGACLFAASTACSQTAPPPKIAAPITQHSLGPSAPQASRSVMRITCWGIHPGPFQQIGTGFLHKSGLVITAKHILNQCRTKDFRLTFSGTKHIKATAEADPAADLALLRPAEKLIPEATLAISKRVSIDVGEKVFIWGFPDGYSGLVPLLIVGYLSGVDRARQNEPMGWVVNASFRSGSSGGPVISAIDGLVIGVASATINDFPAHLTAEILEALGKDHDRLLGFAVAASDLRNFLETKKIDP